MDRSEMICGGTGYQAHGIAAASSIDLSDFTIRRAAPLLTDNNQKAVNLQLGGPGDHFSAQQVRVRDFNHGFYASGDPDGTSVLDYALAEDCDIKISGTASSINEPVAFHRSLRATLSRDRLDANGSGDHGAYVIGNEQLTCRDNTLRNVVEFGIKAKTEPEDTRTVFGVWDITGNDCDGSSAGVVVDLIGPHRLRLLRLSNTITATTDAIGAATAVLVTGTHASSLFDLISIGGHIEDAQKSGVKIDGAAGATVRSWHINGLLVRAFSKAAADTYSGVVTGSIVTVDSVLLGSYDADGAGTGRNGYNFDSATALTIGAYARRNCGVADADPA